MASQTNSSVAGIDGQSTKVAVTTAKVMVNGDILFTAVGDVQITSI